MINLSLQCGTFPDDWKLADVKPRLKKTGAEALFSNLRPISNLSFAKELTERAVFAQTPDHFIANKLYPRAQFSHREFQSTETALLPAKNDILLNMDQQRVTLLVLLDLFAAFDTVDHTIVHFTVVCLVAKPLNRSEAKGDLVMLQTLLLLKCKLICYHAN